MTLEVNSLANFYGSKRRRTLVIEVDNLNEETVKAAIAKKLDIDKDLTIKSEDIKIVEKRKMVLHNYVLVENERKYDEDDLPS